MRPPPCTKRLADLSKGTRLFALPSASQPPCNPDADSDIHCTLAESKRRKESQQTYLKGLFNFFLKFEVKYLISTSITKYRAIRYPWKKYVYYTYISITLHHIYNIYAKVFFFEDFIESGTSKGTAQKHEDYLHFFFFRHNF